MINTTKKIKGKKIGKYEVKNMEQASWHGMKKTVSLLYFFDYLDARNEASYREISSCCS